MLDILHATLYLIGEVEWFHMRKEDTFVLACVFA